MIASTESSLKTSPKIVQLVDEEGRTIGSMEKVEAHRNGGTLHRAISVLLFDADGKMLIQRRSAEKYHFAGLWANAACSHPAADEAPSEAGARAVAQELGLEVAVQEFGRLTYRATDTATGLTEYEFDHLLVGTFSGDPNPDPREVVETRRVSLDELSEWISSEPAQFAPWFLEIVTLIQAPGAANPAEVERFLKSV